jgi:hypothetical protein
MEIHQIRPWWLLDGGEKVDSDGWYVVGVMGGSSTADDGVVDTSLAKCSSEAGGTYEDDFTRPSEAADVDVEVGKVVVELTWSRFCGKSFGRNLRTKHNLVKFKLAVGNVYCIKILHYCTQWSDKFISVALGWNVV